MSSIVNNSIRLITRVPSSAGKLNWKPLRLLSSSSGEPELIVTKEKGLQTVIVNRPDQYNAINVPIYKGITDALNNSAKDDSVKMTLLTGAGAYCSAGNDLKSTMKSAMEDPVKAANEGIVTLTNFLDAFVDYPKVLVAAVNGPCFGIMFTTIALADVIWASEAASFTAPFSKTAQSPEGTSTHMFPLIFGRSMTNELLMFNRTLSVQEAFDCKFVSRIWPPKDFLPSVQAELTKLIEENSTESMCISKSLIMTEEIRAKLKQVIRIENETLKQRWFSSEFAEAMMKFASRKKK